MIGPKEFGADTFCIQEKASIINAGIEVNGQALSISREIRFANSVAAQGNGSPSS